MPITIIDYDASNLHSVSNALKNLVDSLAGFLRDYIEREEYAQKLYKEIGLKQIIRELTVK